MTTPEKLEQIPSQSRPGDDLEGISFRREPDGSVVRVVARWVPAEGYLNAFNRREELIRKILENRRLRASMRQDLRSLSRKLAQERP